MIRHATIEDIAAIAETGQEFHAISGFKTPYDQFKVEAFLAGMVENGVILIAPRGVIGGVIATPFCSDDWRMAVEMFWWAKGDGLRLLTAFEEWAAENGADEVRMSSIASLKRAEKLLLSRGYETTEISYARSV